MKLHEFDYSIDGELEEDRSSSVLEVVFELPSGEWMVPVNAAPSITDGKLIIPIQEDK